MFGVLMCDLSQSRRLSAADRSGASTAIREAVQRVAAKFPCVVAEAFEFRFGDEWQLLLDRPEQVYAVYSHLYYWLPDLPFVCGIGIGPLSTPVTANSHEVDGPAFHLAREALTKAKNHPSRVLFRLPEYARAESTQSVLQSVSGILAKLREGRRESQVAVSKLSVADGLAPSAIAAQLGISRSAVSYRLRSAGVREELGGLQAIEDVLTWFVQDCG